MNRQIDVRELRVNAHTLAWGIPVEGFVFGSDS
jgi:hypothetical protein